MYLSITKDYENNKISLRYGLASNNLVGKKFVKEVKEGLVALDNKDKIHQKNALDALLFNFCNYSEIPFKKVSVANMRTWIVKNIKKIDLYGFTKDEYLAQHIAKNLAGKNCEVIAHGKTESC